MCIQWIPRPSLCVRGFLCFLCSLKPCLNPTHLDVAILILLARSMISSFFMQEVIEKLDSPVTSVDEEGWLHVSVDDLETVSVHSQNIYCYHDCNNLTNQVVV